MGALNGTPRVAPWRPAVVLVFGLLVVLVGGTRAQDPQQLLDETVRTQAQSDSDSAQSQIRISQIADETAELLNEYRLTTQQLDRVRIYNDNLQALITDQEQEMLSIQQQLDDFVVVERGIVPLMIDTIEALEQFIALDMPFQVQERAARVRRLRDNMEAADIAISEKYRQIMDAYLIETDYGRTIEAYVDTIPLEGIDTQVDVLRVGRILLAFQTADRGQTGFWNPIEREWQSLPDEYRPSITQGLRIARRQAAPDLLRVPIVSAEQAP